MKRRRFLAHATRFAGVCALVPAGVALAAEPSPASTRFNVRDFGASGRGTQLDTKALQAALDACAMAGGGTVHFPAGSYLSGTLFLKSRVALHLESGAVLLGSKNLADYPPTIPAIRSYTDNYTERSLLYAENLENISLTGRGVIDGQGAAFQGPYKVRPYLIRVIGCRNVSVRDVTLKDAPMWVQHYLACDNLLLDGLTVRSKANHNNDGIDIDGCQQVRIANCDISSEDDALVLKSTLDRPCKNVVVTNCVLSSDCNAFKLGTESNGGFENIVLNNCAIYDTRLAGLALELVDGGVLDGVSISNVTMRNVGGAIFIRLGHRARLFKEGQARPAIGRLRGISISDVLATGADRTGCSITGLPERMAESIALHNIRITFAGGGSDADARRQPPEHPEKYPEYKMFGVLPAFGFFCRHVCGLSLSNLSLETAAEDQRPSLVCEDVEDLELFRWQSAVASKTNPVLRFNAVRNALIHGCAPREADVFLRVEGSTSRNIRLFANSLAGARKAVELDAGVSATAVVVDEAR